MIEMANKKQTKYIVVEDFMDLKDRKKVYRKGDVYPSPANKKVSDERIKELTSKDNQQGRPVIKAEGQE